MRPRILIFCDFYLPGFKSGGGTWMLVNLVERFSNRYDFHIVTRNYDSKGDRSPYTTVKTDHWNTVGPARVYYFGKRSLTVRRAAELVADVTPDAIYLNSAFSMPVRQVLRARRRGLVRDGIPVILAPCGEMAEGALSSKPLKKMLFLKLALASGLYRDVLWKASFDAEAQEIRNVIGPSIKVLVAPDLAPKKILPDYDASSKPEKKPGESRFAFFSRVVPKKNLKYLLECLTDIHEGRIQLDIIGPIEDLQYWSECQKVIARLPTNVNVTVSGAFPLRRDALERLAKAHFFAMPTLNENFGYVFLEAMAVGCPLLISDRTVWGDIDEKGVGWRVPLHDRSAYAARLRECISMEDSEYSEMSARARRYAAQWLANGEPESANAQVLEHSLKQAHRHSSVSA